MNAIRSSLSRAPSEATSQEQLEAWARQAWRERGVLITWPKQIADDWERQFLTNIGEKLYGKR